MWRLHTRAANDLKNTNISNLLLPNRSSKRKNIVNVPQMPADTNNSAGTAKEGIAEKRFKLPEFDVNTPELWFATAEVIFSANNVVDEKSKFAHLLQHIDSTIAKNIQSVILNSSAENPFTAAKEALLNLYADSVDKKLDKLLSKVSLEAFGKPSLLLQEIKRLTAGCGEVENEQFLKSFFLRKLPPLTRAILADTENLLTVDQLAKKADLIQDSGVPTSLTHSINMVDSTAYTARPEQTTNNANNNLLSTLTNAMALLTTEVAALKGRHGRDRSRSLSPDHSRPRSHSRGYRRHYDRDQSTKRKYRSNTPNRHTEMIGDKCWYHNKYQSKAHRCQFGCKYFPTMSENEN
jgi:hypothetical protein